MADNFTERENYILSNSVNIGWFLEAIDKNNPLHPEEGAAHTESYELDGQNILVPRVRIKDGKAILNKENALEEALERGDYIVVPEGEDPDQYSKDLSKLIGKFRGFNEGGSVESSLRPRARPVKNQTEEMLRPKSREDAKREQQLHLKQFGNLEYRADLDKQLSWNPIARLGYNPDTHKVLKQRAPGTGLAFQGGGPRTIENLKNLGYEDAGKAQRGSVVTTVNYSFSPVISHEFTHAGFDRLRKKRDEDPEAFDKKYGEDAGKILTLTDSGRLEEEYYVELFDDLDTRFNTDILPEDFEQFPKSTIRSTIQSSYLGPAISIEERNEEERKKRIEEIRRFQNIDLRRKEKEKRPLFLDGIDKGILGLMDAAQDILTEQGEPPKAKRNTLSFWEKVGKSFSNLRPVGARGLYEGGLSAQTEQALGQPKKGLSYGELIIDNILGLDNEYESFGEKLGKAINEDEINFLKNAAVGVYEGTKEFITSPVETTKKVVTDIKNSVQRLGTEDLNTRLKNMYGVSYNEATDEQVNAAKEAVFGDALTALELIPAAKGATAAAKAGSSAIPGGIKADVVGQTKALLSGDIEFLKGTPTERSATQSLSAGFTGQNPPTYLKRDRLLSEIDEYEGSVPTEKADLSTIGNMIFRDPIIEFAKTLSIPKKGLLGSEFLNQIRKNESTLETSLQEGIIDPSKRYTRDELLKVLGASASVLFPTKPTFTTFANISPFRIKQFEGFQRQKKVGFKGGTELDYFDIPVDTTINKPGKFFKASSQHYNPETLLHVRGSIINPSGIDFDPDAPSYRREPTEFDYIIDDKNYLLIEEIQSDLLTKGYAKPKNYFDAVFNEAIKTWNTTNTVTYGEVFGDIDKEIKKIIKFLDDPASGHLAPGRISKNPKFYKPGSNLTNFPNNVKVVITEEFIKRAYNEGFTSVEDISDILITIDANKNDIDQLFKDLQDYRSPVDGRSMVVDGSFLKEKENDLLDDDLLDDIAALDDQDDDIVDLDFILGPEDIKNPVELNEKGVKEAFLNYHNSRKQIREDATNEYLNVLQYKINELKIDKEIDVLDLAEIHENYLSSQTYTPDTSSIGLPPIRKNKQVVDEALKVFIAKAAQQGIDKIVIPSAEKIAEARGRILEKDKGDRFYRTYVTDLNKSLEELKTNYPVTIYKDVELPYKKSIANTPSDYKGTIIDISKLIDEYKVEKPRQFAEGGTVMNKQMEMAFMKEGGLKDDGMKVDPVSGNEIPPGSMAKEVRDDIPAQLSEGEYVVPADVVQFYGVKHFEDLRNKAKGGLKQMEKDGRIGGEPVYANTGAMVQGGFSGPSVAPAQPGVAQTPMTPQNPAPFNPMQTPMQGNPGAGFVYQTPGQQAYDQPTRYYGSFSNAPHSITQPPNTPVPVVGQPVTPPVDTPESCEARGMVFNPETGMCVLPDPTETPQPKGDRDDNGSEVLQGDPDAWMNNYNYTDVQSILDSSIKGLEGPEPGTFEALVNTVFGGGALGVLGKAGTAAQIAANVRILESIGATEEAAILKGRLDGFIKSNKLSWIPTFMIDGDQLAATATSILDIENLTEHYNAQKRMDKATIAALGADRAKELEKYAGTAGKGFKYTSPDTGKTTTYETSGYLEAMTDSERKKLGDELNKTALEKFTPKTEAEKEAEAATAKRKAEEAARAEAEREGNKPFDAGGHLNLGSSSGGAGVGGFGGGGGGGVYAGGRARGGLMKRK